MFKLVKLKDAAQQLGISIAALRDWRLQRRNLDFVKVGRSVRIPQSSIDKLIEQQTIKPGLNSVGRETKRQ
jgi:excisionase family DNA binding protein